MTLRSSSSDADQIDCIIDALREAWTSGRSIVPIVGAGLSADSGVPIIRSVIRYFGKLQRYLAHRAYLPSNDVFKGCDPLARQAKLYEKEPWMFVQDFGWIDRFDLNQGLLDYAHEELANGKNAAVPLDPPGQGKTKFVEEEVLEGLETALRRINPEGMWHIGELERDLTEPLLKHEENLDSLQSILDSLADHSSASPELGELKEKLVAAREEFKRKLPKYFYTKTKKVRLARFRKNRANSVSFDLVGDWKKLIQFFTNYQGDYADALFSRLCAGRGPSHGHRYLAFLAKVLGVKTIFTFNFDDFIERSLEYEGMYPKVFAMERGFGLPHDSLIRDSMSVIKLHGSNHALLVDERLDHPLSKEYKERFDRLVGPDPLLLVIGCSGSDFRLRDLVRHVVSRNASNLRSPSQPRVAWIHFERSMPDVFSGIEDRGLILPARTNNPGATLQHCYSALTGRHPASTVAYLAHLQRPVQLGKANPPPQEVRCENTSFAVLSSLRDGRQTDDSYPSPSASETLVELSNYWLREGYHTVWVDLESVHTVAAVVGSIIDQCRLYDPSLAPSVLPFGKADNQVVEIAAQRVRNALQRSRYLVVLDGLEAYPWPPTAHHGETTLSSRDGKDRLDELMKLIKCLVRSPEEIGESKIVVGVDAPKARVIVHDPRVTKV